MYNTHMRLNAFIAANTSLSRRNADDAIDAGRVTVDGDLAVKGTVVEKSSQVKLDGQVLTPRYTTTTIMLHKPTGYVCSRNGQGSCTVFALLPPEHQHLQPVGRLDKDTSGLLLLTDNGILANQLTHPRYAKQKVYNIVLNIPLQPLHQQLIVERGIILSDGISKFGLERLHEDNNREWLIRMSEGRNRQIRRTFEALGYKVKKLHRTQFGEYNLGTLAPCKTVVIEHQERQLYPR